VVKILFETNPIKLKMEEKYTSITLMTNLQPIDKLAKLRNEIPNKISVVYKR
jgi:hypothetical protein